MSPPRNGRRPQKTAMLIAQQIVGEITDRGLKAGDPLLPEREMLERYGVARGTLREALRFLEIQGVIQIKTGPGGGPIVAEPTGRPLASIIALLLQLSNTPFRAVLEARSGLEPVMAASAAERISVEELEALRSSVERMEEQLDDLDAFLQENETFHALIADAAENQVFALVNGSLNWICDGTPLGIDYPPKARQSVVKHHKNIYEAIAARDPERAAEAMREHLADYTSYVERFYPRTVDTALRWDQVQW